MSTREKKDNKEGKEEVREKKEREKKERERETNGIQMRCRGLMG
jgi:hypothetical protein